MNTPHTLYLIRTTMGLEKECYGLPVPQTTTLPYSIIEPSFFLHSSFLLFTYLLPPLLPEYLTPIRLSKLGFSRCYHTIARINVACQVPTRQAPWPGIYNPPVWLWLVPQHSWPCSGSHRPASWTCLPPWVCTEYVLYVHTYTWYGSMWHYLLPPPSARSTA